MTKAPFDILILPDERAARVVATWQYAEWGQGYSGTTFDDLLSETNRSIGSSTIPITFIASVGNEIVGTASIIENDLPTREDINPWLASIFVARDWRRQGIASTLIKTALAHAKLLHVNRLFLFTYDLDTFYMNFGFKKVDSGEFMGKQVSIMMYE